MLGSTVIGDPHCVGFFGEDFDFMGIDGRYYNILSTGTLQINGRVKAMKDSSYTFLDEVAIKIGQAPLLTYIRMGLATDAKGYAIGHIHEELITRDPSYFATGLKRSDGGVTTGSVHLDVDTVVVGSGSCVIKIVRGTEDVELGNIPHLNLYLETTDIGLVSDGITPHGIIGQTACPDRVRSRTLRTKTVPESVYRLHEEPSDVFMKRTRAGLAEVSPRDPQGSGVIEGTYQDYEVSSPFADDCKFNRFGTQPTIPPRFGQSSGLVAFL